MARNAAMTGHRNTWTRRTGDQKHRIGEIWKNQRGINDRGQPQGYIYIYYIILYYIILYYIILYYIIYIILYIDIYCIYNVI